MEWSMKIRFGLFDRDLNNNKKNYDINMCVPAIDRAVFLHIQMRVCIAQPFLDRTCSFLTIILLQPYHVTVYFCPCNVTTTLKSTVLTQNIDLSIHR